MKANLTPPLELQTPGLTSSTFADLVSATDPESPNRTEGGGPRPAVTQVGSIVALGPSGLALVDFAGNPDGQPQEARSACAITTADIGREAVLVFENNDPRKPIVMGLLQPVSSDGADSEPVQVSLDGEQVTLSAKNEIVLRCGKASITLTRAGKVLIRGAYLLSRSSGVNRIKGGSVQIN